MMMLAKTKLVFIVAVITVFTMNHLEAQKVPNRQVVSLWAPNIKIDGRPTEWGNKLQAYNAAALIFYTLSNDNDNLYLTVQAKNPDVANKAVGGVIFAIQPSLKKQDEGAISITYPKTNGLYFPLRNINGEREDIPAANIDTVIRRYNDTLNVKCKTIGVKGIPGVDTLISVYNNDGIKAAGQFNNKAVYTLELAMPLKYLGLAAGEAVHIAYHITVKGRRIVPFKAVGATRNGQPVTLSAAQLDDMSAIANIQLAGENGPTDFWGDYTLAKKP